MRLHRAPFPWEIALLPQETVFNSVTDVSQGKFPVLNKQVYFTLIELICWAILIWEQYLQKKFVLFLACNQTANYLAESSRLTLTYQLKFLLNSK